ncbi:MAG TPA: hypothetical protein PLK12_15160 [Prolixibacteraceae bacterium]|nr:hypothetical protein [Prolixibacteraceae bacterium]
MEDLIPLIIIILLSVVSAVVRKKRKGQAVERTISPPPKRQEDLFTWLEQLNPDTDEEPAPGKPSFWDQPLPDEKEPVTEIPDTIPPEQKVSTVFDSYSGVISEEEKKDLMSREGIPAITDRTRKKTEDPVKEEAELVPEYDAGFFDLRQAVIFSEILNRKYDE